MDTILPPYAELHCVSNFTFLRGASHPEELVSRAAQIGYTSIAITDECSLAGVVRAHVEAKNHGIHLILGSEVTLQCGLKLVLLAMDRQGYGNLAEWITIGRQRADKGSYEMHREDIGFSGRPEHGSAHLKCLPGCYALMIPQRVMDDRYLSEQATWISDTFSGRASIAVEFLQQQDDEMWLERLTALSRQIALPLVAAGDVHMHVRSRKPLQDTLTAIRLGKPVAKCGLNLHPNAEQHLRQRFRLAQIYARPLLEQTRIIAARCTFSLKELEYQYPEEIAPSGEPPIAYLRRIAYEGAAERFPKGIPSEVQSQIEHELNLIDQLNYAPYFLTVFDIVRFARSQGILCQGRGSSANSVICYCLRVTEVDPTRSSLLFERFISAERSEPPDIDVDFEHERREIVMQWIYSRYGRHRAALTGAITTYRPKSAIKDIGKALGMDFDHLNAISSAHHWWSGRDLDMARLQDSGLDPGSPIVRKLVDLSRTLIGFPRHLSQHTGGFVIARDDLRRLVPIENAAMQDRSVIQWDKDDIDEMKMMKVDVLALGILSAIRRALEFISEHRGESFTMQDIPAECPQTYEMICRADTVGIFQIESRAQMAMCARLKPRCFYDLVIQVAIVRPGPIQGGMVHPYLSRRQGLEKVEYPSEEIQLVLERTLGVPVFQEQVMQIAMVAAGFTAGEADQLRRAMAAWKRKGGLDKYQNKLIAGMLERGYTKKFADSIALFCSGFAEYGFPESHAASFSLLVYASAWVKCHEPAIFLAALLNSQPLGFYSPSALVQDAKRHGVEVRPPDVTISDWDCTLEEPPSQTDSNQPAVRLGLRLVKGLRVEAAENISIARAIAPFKNVDDLTRRAGLTTIDLQALARANALIALSGHRRQASWDVAAIKSMPKLLQDAPIPDDKVILPQATEGQEIVADYDSIGLTLNRHPLALLRPRLKEMNLSTAAELKTFPDRKLVRSTGIVIVRQRPGTANGVMFLTIEDETGNSNVIIWPSLLERQRAEALNASLLTIYGQLQVEGDVRHLVAMRLVDHTELLGNLSISSRDFH